MNKKQYIMPKETVVELGPESQLLGVSGNAPTDDNGLDKTPGTETDPDDGENMTVKAQRNMWDNQW